MNALAARSARLNEGAFVGLAELSPSFSGGGDVPAAEQLVRCLDKLPAPLASEAVTAMFATFFALLMNFIGERLVMQLVRCAFARDENGSKETE